MTEKQSRGLMLLIFGLILCVGFIAFMYNVYDNMHLHVEVEKGCLEDYEGATCDFYKCMYKEYDYRYTDQVFQCNLKKMGGGV